MTAHDDDTSLQVMKNHAALYYRQQQHGVRDVSDM